MTKNEMNTLAASAANDWCRCFKCDRIVNETGDQCLKPCGTCTKWFDGYKTAMIALEKLEKQKEPKPAEWSEEDEKIRNAIIGFINPDKGGTKYSSYANLTEWSNWLKSLRPSWKPSEEQMMKGAVEGRIHAIGFHNAIYIKEPKWTDMLDKYEEGDKVRVIVLPMEDEK